MIPTSEYVKGQLLERGRWIRALETVLNRATLPSCVVEVEIVREIRLLALQYATESHTEARDATPPTKEVP